MHFSVNDRSVSAHQAQAAKARSRRVALALTLALAAGYFYLRGPRRALQPGGSADFQYIFYIGLRTFALGGNPYEAGDMLGTAQSISRRYAYIVQKGYGAGSPYPPGFFVLLAPLGLLPLRAAVWCWLFLQGVSFAALLWWAWNLHAQADAGGAKKLLFLACGLALAPVHTSLAVGNTGTPFAALTTGLFYAILRNRTGWGGLALGLLMSKPTFGIPAAMVVALCGRGRVLAVGAAVCAASWAPVCFRLGLLQTVVGWRRNVAAITVTGKQADATFANPVHYQLLNIQSWWYTFTGPGWAEVGSLLVLAFLLGGLYRFRREIEGHGGIYWTLATVFLLLSMYHRFYDAALLAVPLAALFHLHRCQPWYTRAAAVSLAPFAVPGATFLHLKLESVAHRFPLVEAVVVRHDVVALLLLAVVAGAALVSTGPARAVRS